MADLYQNINSQLDKLDTSLLRKGGIGKIAIVALVVLVVMYFGRILFVPLFFGVLISFILYPACRWMENKGVPKSGAITIGLIAVILPVVGICYVLVMQVIEIGHSWNLIWTKLGQVPWLTDIIGTPAGPQQGGKNDWINKLISKNSSQVFSGVIASVTTLVQIVIIPIYVAIILYQRHRLLEFIQHLFPPSEADRVKSVLQETVLTYYNFVKGMIVVYTVVGILNSAGLFFLGIPNPIIYGFSAAILTFIPYVGIMIASVMPMITAWAMYDSIYYPLGVAAVFAFVQFLEANIIFPLAVSYRVKVNMLFTLIAIFLGGIIWGASGMILFVPFFAILKLIADKSEKYKAFGALLGDEDDSKKKPKIPFVKK